ncbi:hypothetical protein CLV83_2202 [Marinobacterium mangrovicola]|uniref:Uncharacterized protein n=1 Tax=Marinobacterium mangrovicola TaxID=1476959 RepID=A0A4R1GGX3_9GAMM|nr:hypothetical protein CLV83_2202 [Marinobacterium mangrovicola]
MLVLKWIRVVSKTVINICGFFCGVGPTDFNSPEKIFLHHRGHNEKRPDAPYVGWADSRFKGIKWKD